MSWAFAALTNGSNSDFAPVSIFGRGRGRGLGVKICGREGGGFWGYISNRLAGCVYNIHMLSAHQNVFRRERGQFFSSDREPHTETNIIQKQADVLVN